MKIIKLIVTFESSHPITIRKKVTAEFWVYERKYNVALDKDSDEIKEALNKCFAMFKKEEFRIDIFVENEGQIIQDSQQRFLIAGIDLKFKKGVKNEFHQYSDFVLSDKKEFFSTVSLLGQYAINVYLNAML